MHEHNYYNHMQNQYVHLYRLHANMINKQNRTLNYEIEFYYPEYTFRTISIEVKRYNKKK